MKRCRCLTLPLSRCELKFSTSSYVVFSTYLNVTKSKENQTVFPAIPNPNFLPPRSDNRYVTFVVGSPPILCPPIPNSFLARPRMTRASRTAIEIFDGKGAELAREQCVVTTNRQNMIPKIENKGDARSTKKSKLAPRSDNGSLYAWCK